MSREKRSISLHGHRTSVALEPEFWAIIDRVADKKGLSVSALLMNIDDERVKSRIQAGLASYIRVWVLNYVLAEPR